MRLQPLRIILVVLACLPAACRDVGSGNSATRSDVTAPDPTGVAPAALLDLDHWYLTLPVDAQGGTSSEAASVEPAELLTGYDSDWFYGSDFGGREGVTFWAPVNGARTPRALYARSELRELLDPPDRAQNWLSTGFAQLSATVVVHRAPLENGKVTVGQIVGYDRDNPDVSRLARVIFEHNASGAAKLYLLVFDSPNASNSSGQALPITDAVRLSQPFSYTLTLDNKQLSAGSGTATASAPVNDAWDGVGLYFRAGAQVHARGSAADDGALVTVFELDVSH